MGVRIVVVFQGDMSHVWGSDPNLGKRIQSHMLGVPGRNIDGAKVVEIFNDNMQSLLVMDRYDTYCLSYKQYTPGQDRVAACIKLLRSAAHTLGHSVYRNFLKRPHAPVSEG